MVWGCTLGSPAVSDGKHQVLGKLLLAATGLGCDLGTGFWLGIEEWKLNRCLQNYGMFYLFFLLDCHLNHSNFPYYSLLYKPFFQVG